MNRFGYFWKSFDKFRQIWTRLDKVWIKFEKFKLPPLHSVSRNCDSGFGFKSHIVHCGTMFNKTSSWIKSDCTRWAGFIGFILDVRFGRFWQAWIMSRYQRQHYLLGKKCKLELFINWVFFLSWKYLGEEGGFVTKFEILSKNLPFYEVKENLTITFKPLES